MIDARKSRYIAAAIIAAALLVSAGMVTISCAGIKSAVRDAAPEEDATLADYDIRLINAGACKLYLTNGSTIDAYQVKSASQLGGELTINCRGTYDTDYRLYVIPIAQIVYISR